MKFYRSTTSEFSISAPKCQDSFKSICSKSTSAPSYISVPTRQFTTMESVKREHVQVLGFVSHFIRALEKCASNMEDILQSGAANMEDSLSKDIEELMSYIQLQYSTIASIERALETVVEASVTMSCNMQLARRDTILKYSAPHLHEHDRNRLRRSGFTSTDLFSPSVLNNVENKYERSRSPKRQKMDSKPIFNSRKGRSDYNNSSFPNTSSKNSFRGQQDNKPQFKPTQATRGGRGGRRK